MSTNAKRGLLLAVALCFISTLAHGYLVLLKTKQHQPAADLVTRAGLSALVGAWFLYQYLQQAEREKESSADRPFASLVVLLKNAPSIRDGQIAEAAARALDVVIDPADPECENRVSGQSPVFLLQLRGHMFVVNNYDGPYFREAIKDAKCIPDPELQAGLNRHQGWMSMDLIQYPDGASVSAAYRMIGPVLAELCGSDCLAFHCPEAGYWAAWSEAQLDILRSSDPLMAMESGGMPSLMDMPDEAPVMIQAAEEARNRWQEFLQAYDRRDSTQAFFVKVRLEQDAEEEYPWVSVTSVSTDRVMGTIDTELETIQLPQGTKVQAALSDIWDWMIVPAGGAAPIGYFTQEVALRNG